jgi:hypothetical protein
VVDTRTSKVYSVANGGHNDYAGNEVDALDLERDQPVWTQVLAPTPNAQINNGESYYLDGRPAARHTYYGVTFNELDDRIMLFGGAVWCGSGCGHNAVSSYNIGANTYSPSTTHPDLPTRFGSPFHPTYVADPSTGDVYVVWNQAAGRWTRSSNTFITDLSASGNIPGGATMAAFDTSRSRILVLGGFAGDHHLYALSSNAFSTVTLSGASAANVANLDVGAMIYVPPLDRFLVRATSAGGTVYQVNASTFEVTTLATTGGTSIPATLNGPYNKFLYVPRLNGAVYVPCYDAVVDSGAGLACTSGNAWFLRLH